MENIQPIENPKISNESQKEKKERNKIGLIGFIFALLGFVFCWIPVLNILLWLLGLIFSIIGICRVPRIFAGIGIGITCISIWLVLLSSLSVIAGIVNYMDPGQTGTILDDECNTKRIEYVEVQGRNGNVMLYVGMPKDSVRQLVGKPGSVKLDTYGNTTVERWGYRIKSAYIDDLEIEFSNGRLESIDQDNYKF